MPPTAGTEWHAAQLVPLKAGPSPSSAVSTSRKSSRPSRNSSNSAAVMPGSGSPGSGARVCATRTPVAAKTRAESDDDGPRRRAHFVSLSRSTTTMVPRMKPWPAPQMREHSKV